MDINKNEWILTEKYRPKKVADCILPKRLKDTFQGYVDTGKIPNLLLTGTAGVGKTTVALAMCDELGIKPLFINSSDERGIDVLRTKIKSYASTMSLTETHKVIILDEADNITVDAQAGLRGAIEAFSSNCTFILTCNFKSKLIDAIHSRTAVIDFKLNSNETAEMQAEFFKRLQKILTNEDIKFDKKSLAVIVTKYFPDYRRTINELQRLSQLGDIDAGAVSVVSDVRNLQELYTFLRDKEFTKMRKWVVDNGDVDSTTIFRKIYDGLNEYVEASSIPQAIIILAKYQYQSAFVADQEVNLVAALTEIMVDCEFTAF